MKPWEEDWSGVKPDADVKPWEMNYATQGKPAMEHQTYSRVPPVQRTGNVLDLLKGVGSGIADLGRGVKQRYTEAGVALDKFPASDRDKLYAEEAARRENREFNPEVTGMERMGRGVGMIGGTLPLAFVPVGQTAVGTTISSLLAGGLAGSMLPTTSGREALANAGMGALGQAGGNLVSRSLLPTGARNLSQAQKDIIEASQRENIPLRTSEATGSNVIKNWEQMRANRPITGGMEERFNKAQTEAINRAITRKLGGEIDEVNDASLLGFRNKIGGEISGMVQNKRVPLDTDFLNALSVVDADAGVGGRLTYASSLRSTIDDALDLIASKPQGVSGEVAQRIRSKLMDRARDARAADNTELANGLEDIVAGLKDAITGTMTAAERKAWSEANRRYANYKLVEESFVKDPRSLAMGDVPINKLARVMEQNRPRSYVHGTGDFSSLAKLGQVIRPPGRSALLGEQALPVIRNMMDAAHGVAYPVIESQLMQRYLTGGLPGQKLIRDIPGGAKTTDALLRAAGLTMLLDEENLR